MERADDSGIDVLKVIKEKYRKLRRNVVLVGPTGSGKSTFGNYLCSKGQIEFFPTSPSLACCTKKILNHPFQTVDDIDINVIDTPGMGDEEDVHNMEMLLRMVNQLEHISCICICVAYSQRDDTYGSFGPTIKYYSELFKPVFNRGNVILLVTQVDPDNFEEWSLKGSVNTLKEDKLKRCREVTEGTDIPICELINSKISARNLKNLENIKGDDEDEIHNIYFTSLRARERIIKFITMMEPVTMTSHLLPLPPKMELVRLSCVNILVERIRRLQYVGQTKGKETQQNIEKLKEYGTELNILVDQIRHEKAKLDTLKDVIVSHPQYFHGDEVFHLSRKEDCYFFLQHKEYVTKFTAWNCTVEWKSIKQDSGGPLILPFDVIPDLVNVTRGEMKPSEFYRWFLVVRVEYDGQMLNKDQILETSTSVRLLMEKHTILTSKIENLNQSIMEVSLEASDVAKKLQALEDQKAIISKNSFWLNEISQVVDSLNELNTRNNNIGNNNSSTI